MKNNESTELNEDIKIPSGDRARILKNIKETIYYYEKNRPNIEKEKLNLEDIKEETLNNKFNNKYINGVRNSFILKDLVLGELDREESTENLIYKNDFYVNRENTGPNILTMGGGFYFYSLLYKDRIVIYELDNFFKVSKRNSYKIKDIENFKVMVEDYCIKLVMKNGEVKDTFFMFDFKKENLLDFEKKLDSLNIKNLTGTKKTGKDIRRPVGYKFWYLTSIIYSIFIVIALISVLYHYI